MPDCASWASPAQPANSLREFWKIAEPALPGILDGFYRHVTKAPQLSSLIGNDIPRLKAAQGSHWARLFNGRFDHEYMKGVRAIGMVHSKIGLEPRWYIGAYNFVLNQLVALAVRRYRWRPATHLSELLAAVNCAVMLNMEIAISVYQEAMLAEREKSQQNIRSRGSGIRRQNKRGARDGRRIGDESAKCRQRSCFECLTIDPNSSPR